MSWASMPQGAQTRAFFVETIGNPQIDVVGLGAIADLSGISPKSVCPSMTALIRRSKKSCPTNFWWFVAM